MTRRRQHKRSRQKKAKFHKVKEPIRKNVQPQLFNSRNEDKDTSDASHPRQCSPESVLFESQHADSLGDNKLSPEIFPKRSRRSEGLKNDSEIDDGTAARMLEQFSPISSEGRGESDLPLCDFKHDAKCVNDFSSLEDSGERERNAGKSIASDPFDLTENCSFSLSSLSNELNNNGTADVTHNGRSLLNAIPEAACRDTSEAAISQSNLESRSGDGAPANSNGKRSAGEDSCQREDHYILETMDDCYLLDKTLSMNDNLLREINGYLDGQPSTVISGKLGRDRTPKLSHFTILRETDERGGASVRRSVAGPDDGSRDNPDKRKWGTSGDGRGFDVTLEKIGERLTENWREFRKIFAHLRRTNRKTRGEDAAERGESLLHRYRRLPYTISVSTLSLPASALSTPSSSPRRVDRDETRGSEGPKREAEKTGIPSESTTPRVGLVKRCRRTTLMFGDEDEGETTTGHRQPATRADITEPFPEEKKEGQGCSFLSGPPSFCDETRQDSRVLESIATDIGLSDRDGRCGFPQKVYNLHKQKDVF